MRTRLLEKLFADPFNSFIIVNKSELDEIYRSYGTTITLNGKIYNISNENIGATTFKVFLTPYYICD